MVTEEWEWFCGRNTSYLNTPLDEWVNNTCFINGVSLLPHAGFIALSSLLLFVFGCCSSYRKIKTKYILTFPGHSLRWIVSILTLLLLGASIGEGVLTDETYKAWQQPTQPHLYMHGAGAFLACVFSLIYYHHMELWQAPFMSFLLLGYWATAAGGEALRMSNLVYQNQIDFNVLRFDLTVALLVCFGLLFLIEVYVILARFVQCCGSYNSRKLPADLSNSKMKFMNYNVNLASYLTYWWVNWLFTIGYNKAIDQDDLGDIPNRHSARHNHKKFKEAFELETAKARKKGKSPSLTQVYIKVYGFRLMTSLVLKIIADMLGLIGPVCVGGLTSYVITIVYPSDDGKLQPHFVTVTEYFGNGFVLVAVMFLAASAKAIILQCSFHWGILESIDARTSLQTMVYEKALRLSTYATTGGKMTMGQITNHMSTDAMAVLYMFQTFYYLFSIPIQITVTLVLLYFQLGFSALLGFAVFVVLIPIQLKVATIMTKRQKDVLGCSDQRLKQSNELLQGIKLLKLYAWEQIYCEAIEAVRKRELGFLRKINHCLIVTILITTAAPILVTLVGFGTYTALTGKPLTPDVTFSSLALFNQLAMPLFILPMSLAMLVNGLVSTKRLLTFLLAPEVEGKESSVLDDDEDDAMSNDQEVVVKFRQPEKVTVSPKYTKKAIGIQTDDMELVTSTDSNVNSGLNGTPNGAFISDPEQTMESDIAVEITNGNFKWDPESDVNTMSDINVKIPAGKLTMIIGQVGSGKSSLLSAILGEMTTVSGDVQINSGKESIAFAAQKPWLLNGSLQDNILFSSDMNRKRYKCVIEACALKPDIDILPAGDQTEIGEKGINMSGGQKQRISVARTMYSGRQLIILDDPLSALDVHVGRHLFEEGIVKWLLDNKQTVILVTHQLQYLNRADLIIEVKEGRICATGSLDDVIKADPETYSSWAEAIKEDEEPESEEVKDVEEERKSLKRQLSKKDSFVKQMSKEEKQSGGKLIEKEEQARGSVSYTVYLYYMKNVGWGLISFVFLALITQTSLNVGKNFWLSSWSEAGLSNESATSTAEYLGGYAGLSVAAIVSQLMAFSALVTAALIGGRRLHHNMLQNIIMVPLRFFDTTPVGRVLNRFSNDTQLIDSRLAQTFNSLLGCFLQCLSAVVVNTIVMPFFIIFVIPIAIGYYFLQKYFIATSRELQRLDSTSKSPIFAFFSESLGGLSTIRAYGDGKRFYKTLIKRIDTNLGPYLYLQAANRWLATRLDLIGSLFVLLAGLSTLIGALLFGVDPSLVGLAVTYSLQVSGYLNWLVRSVADAELQMNAVERVKFYSDVENEPYEGKEPAVEWPSRGQIKFEEVSVRYAKDLDAVLKRVSVCLKPGEKVGICGRTGSGKSTLTLALLRVIDIFEGQVLIDDVDIKSVPLTSLRSKLSIIPQDPVLFTGSVRKNLDPMMQQSDDDLWKSLEIAQLKEVVSQLEGGLDASVTEGGENFSVGQRQLFCLARAFLRKSRILIMDEATASIDMETDKILQTVVATAFADRTVLTIAHRIATILDSDSILVLDDGHVAEYGSPAELLAKENGLFASLVNDD
ncbi:ATP-binding cassette sub-family C member 9-like [Asterias amurensis]|uniref:ATP-binding cassette sub-family C member 9-like n=1 Tax=Asterias amurensis TaxID=7602 RepID=UPI003AB815E7